ncbi:glycoside hydrolase family 43 protein [Deinococcus humi]|uniref:Xylan 1,4-beta-xylosidase n=1 Tax=Deinococcus humi TaxID=662880 RepID=A0A7W8JTN3_9DEIO|nr:glycoside hydrolase family 43 protein [Deinococcus humi]MBB5362588.1 xylan 1,4-beta-xylosidase [Deinococcus humi]GGO31480.1 xylan 1,4-beta-xylosidase [Deinococcus humi]
MTSQLERPARPGTVTVTNPVLRGFHPDPSIVRVGQDYYLATSTFQWYPGVAIYHSRDLVNWRPAAQPLTRTTLLDMRGNADSGGIWAPALSHDGERFHLIYTDVKSWGSAEVFKDSHNFLTTAEQIEGPWSEPVYLNSSGFDPSLFHDTHGSTVVDEGGDGRKWFVNMRWDHRQGRNRFSGIVLQEYSPEERRLVGPREIIFEGTELGVTEAPHLFRRGGWYYLLTAEGGTSYEHAVTLARSRSLHGPYEVHPDNPVLSAVDAPGLPIQKSGHASFTNTPDGQWLLAYLCGRPLSEQGECPLGRETALQALVWDEDGWPRLASGGHHPQLHTELPALPPQPWPTPPARDGFSSMTLRPEWMTLRAPAELMGVELTGHSLRLTGHESLNSKHRLALVGRRLQSLEARFRTALSFDPEDFQQMAGVCAYYDSRNWVFLRLSRDETLGRTLALLQSENGAYRELLSQEVPVGNADPVELGLVYSGGQFWFEYSVDGETWQSIGDRLSAGLLSDEHCGGLSFTGTFLALTCQDLSGRGRTAEFHWAEYTETE